MKHQQQRPEGTPTATVGASGSLRDSSLPKSPAPSQGTAALPEVRLDAVSLYRIEKSRPSKLQAEHQRVMQEAREALGVVIQVRTKQSGRPSHNPAGRPMLLTGRVMEFRECWPRESLAELARRFGVSRGTVSTWARRLKLKPKGTGNHTTYKSGYNPRWHGSISHNSAPATFVAAP